MLTSVPSTQLAQKKLFCSLSTKRRTFAQPIKYALALSFTTYILPCRAFLFFMLVSMNSTQLAQKKCFCSFSTKRQNFLQQIKYVSALSLKISILPLRPFSFFYACEYALHTTCAKMWFCSFSTKRQSFAQQIKYVKALSLKTSILPILAIFFLLCSRVWIVHNLRKKVVLEYA